MMMVIWKAFLCHSIILTHYSDVIITMMVPQITSHTVVYSTVYSDADQRKHQSTASLAFVWGIHRDLVNSPHKGPVTQKMFLFDDVIMIIPISTTLVRYNHRVVISSHVWWYHWCKYTGCVFINKMRTSSCCITSRHLAALIRSSVVLAWPIEESVYAMTATGNRVTFCWVCCLSYHRFNPRRPGTPLLKWLNLNPSMGK